jgi:nucleotide-binding universal stress UspA family protein
VTWKPIIAGVDGSPESLRAAALAWRIARAADARCILVYSVPDVWAPGGVAPLMHSPGIFDRLAADVRRCLADEVGAEIPVIVRDGLVARPGRPGVVLAEVAREYDAELIVVGGRHHGALARSWGGSTAHYLVRTVDIPVLVVGPGRRVPERMLVATDVFDAAIPTLAAAARYAGLLGARLRAVHVVEPAKYPTVVPLSLDQGEYERRARAAFERLIEKAVPSVAPADRVTREGLADEGIAEEAAAWEADVTVVGSHGKGWMDRMLIGSTTERLLNRLPTSLLVVPILRRARRRAAQTQKARKRRASGPKGKVVI